MNLSYINIRKHFDFYTINTNIRNKNIYIRVYNNAKITKKTFKEKRKGHDAGW